jgi:ubiquinone/menaquinone biosynthesis C-methylase UbiE
MVMVIVATVREEFDYISEIYDSTRRTPMDAELNVISSELAGCRTILDVGVGTGRFAKPLSELGFKIIGIDISRKMMLKAKQKGIKNLILADARNMPFKNRSFDASIIIHVIHLVQDWLNVIHEIGRVTKKKVALLSNKHVKLDNTINMSSNSSTSQRSDDLWILYAKLSEEMGYPLKRTKRMWQNEEEIQSTFPPLKLVKVSDEIVLTSISDQIARFQQRISLMLQDIPSDVHNKIIQKLLLSIVNADQKGRGTASTNEEQQITRREIEELAIWRPGQLCIQ